VKLYSLKFVRMFKIVPTPMPWPAGGKRFLSHAKGPGATWPACSTIASHALDGFCPPGCQRTRVDACCVVLLVFRRPYRRHPCTSEPEVISTVQTALALGSAESLHTRCRYLCPVPRLPRSSLERERWATKRPRQHSTRSVHHDLPRLFHHVYRQPWGADQPSMSD
jgi:hypothetical protein